VRVPSGQGRAMKVAIAYKKSGSALAVAIKAFLHQSNYAVLDFGNSSPQIDYVDLTYQVGQTILDHQADKAILICVSGLCTCIAANKIKGLYAAPCYDPFEAHLSRSRFNTNVLCLSNCWTNPKNVHNIIREWLETPFEKHTQDARAFDKIKAIEEEQLFRKI
jgi:RpiB/LacA/LacB family sugar-phosphate isomerase